jgi:hypothetical protein
MGNAVLIFNTGNGSLQKVLENKSSAKTSRLRLLSARPLLLKLFNTLSFDVAIVMNFH